MHGYTPAVRLPASLGALAGRYRADELIGRGGMGDVYGGVDLRLKRPIAVKLLRADLAMRQEVRRRFDVEARAAARLVHPHVVAVFDSGETDDGTPFIVMERLPGGTLADALGGGAVETDWLLDVVADVLAALDAAHASGIVHRDVKPSNVLLGADGRAKVADFGIAKSLDLDLEHMSHATDGVVGTPAYLAPERIDGAPATPRSDLYSVGVILYEGLAGEKPFRGASAVEVATAARDRRFVPLAVRRPDLPRPLVAALDQAMAADPQARYASAREMAVELRRARASRADATTVLSVPAVPAVAADATLVLPATPQAASPAVALSATASPRRRLLSRADRRSALFGAAVAAILAVGTALVILSRLLADPAVSTPSPSTTVPRVTVTTEAPVTVPPVDLGDTDGDDKDEDDEEHGGRGKGKKD